jgi:hypothetical protein
LCDILSSTVTISGSTFTDNHALYSGGLYAILAGGSLMISNSQITSNTSVDNGGGLGVEEIVASSTVMLSGCTIADNTTASQGGGLWTKAASTTIDSCTFANNKATNGGGGIVVMDGAANQPRVVTVTRSTFNGNRAGQGDGGGILTLADGVMDLTNDTLFGNLAGSGGGGLAVDGNTQTNLVFDTVVGNMAYGGGGLYNNTNLNVNLADTVVAGNLAVPTPNNPGFYGYDLNGSFVDLFLNNAFIGHNFIGINDGNTNSSLNILNLDRVGTFAAPMKAKFLPLANNGGPTQTLKPAAASLLLGAAFFDSNVQTVTTTDQRGKPRPVNGSVDIGAYQTP